MREIETRQIYLLGVGKRDLVPEKIIFQPAKRFQPVNVTAPFAWNADPFSDNNWQAQLQMWRPLDAHMIEYRRTRNTAWLVEPQKLIEDWRAYYLIHAPSRYVWADMTLGMRAMKLAWFLSLHYSGAAPLPSSFISICEELRKSHLDLLFNEEEKTVSNHAFVDLHGAMALARTLPEDEEKNAISRIHAQFASLLSNQFGKDGVHRENSPQYQEFVLRYLQRMLATGWFSNFDLENIIKRAQNVLNWFRMPDGRLPPIGDTNFDRPGHSSRAKVHACDGEIFNSSGYVVIKPVSADAARASYLFFMGARHSLTHKHSDDLSVFWHENEDILIDPGKFAYQDSAERSYVRSTRAHNTLEIDHCDEYSRGRPRRPRAPLTQIDEAFRTDDIFIIRSSMLIQEHDVTHRRMLAYKPGKWLFVADSVFSTRPHDYIIHWHFMSGTQIDIDATGAVSRLPSGRGLFLNFHSSMEAHPSVVTAQRKPLIQGFAGGDYGKLVPAPDLLTSCTSECWQFASLFSLDVPVSLHRLGVNEYALEGSGESRVIKVPRIALNPLY